MPSLTPSDVPDIHDWHRLLEGREAVVTGGGAGIGRATVELFVEHGATVHVAENDPDLVDDLGTLEPGKLADIVLFAGDPMEGFWNMLDARIVLKGGVIVVDKR